MEHLQQQYQRSHEKLSFIGPDGNLVINKAKVLVIGAGGLGCPCLLYLAGSGVGTIGIADNDVVSVSNLHRQLLYQMQHIHKPKVLVAAEQLGAHNPHINVQTHQLYVDAQNLPALIFPYDIVVDATDNFATRYAINDACVLANKPLVYGAIHQTEGHLTVFNYQGSATLRCLFPQNNETATAVPSCADIGAYNIITGIIGNMMANEVIKILVGHSSVLQNTLLNLDCLTYQIRKIQFLRNAASAQLSLQAVSNAVAVPTITPTEVVLQKPLLTLIDIRSHEERSQMHIGGIHVPMLQLLSNPTAYIQPNQTVVLYCASGQRSHIAAMQLQGFAEAVYSLSGGAAAFLALTSKN